MPSENHNLSEEIRGELQNTREQDIKQRREQSARGQGNAAEELPCLNETMAASEPSLPPILKRQCGSIDSSSEHCQDHLELSSPPRDDASGASGLAPSPGDISLCVGGGIDRMESWKSERFHSPQPRIKIQSQSRGTSGNAKTVSSQCQAPSNGIGWDDGIESNSRNDRGSRDCSSNNISSGSRCGSQFFTPPRVFHKQAHPDPSQFNRNRANTCPNRSQGQVFTPAIDSTNALYQSPEKRRTQTQFFTPQRNRTPVNDVLLSPSSALRQRNESSSSSEFCQTSVDCFTDVCNTNKPVFARARANTCPHKPQSRYIACDDSVAVSIRPRESDVDLVDDVIEDGITRHYLDGVGRSLFEDDLSIRQGRELELNFVRESVNKGSSDRTQIFVKDVDEENSREQNRRIENEDEQTPCLAGTILSSPISRRRSARTPLLSLIPRPELPRTPAASGPGQEGLEAGVLTATPSPAKRSFSIHSTNNSNGGEFISATSPPNSSFNNTNSNAMTSPETTTPRPSSSTSRPFTRNNSITDTIRQPSQHSQSVQSRRWAKLLLKGFSALSIFAFLSYTYRNANNNYSKSFEHYSPIEINYRDMALAFSTGGIPGIGSWTSGSASNSGDTFGQTVTDDAQASGDDDGGDKNPGPVVGADGTPVIKLSDFMPTNEKNNIPDTPKEVSVEARKKRRPAMSHARSSYVTSPVSQTSRQRRTFASVASPSSFSSSTPNSSEWSFSEITWILIWIGFMLPVLEMWWRETRRRFRLFFGHRRGVAAGMRRTRSLSDSHIQ